MRRLSTSLAFALALVVPHLAHADGGGTDYADQIKVLFRVAACGSDAPVPERFSAKAIESHCKEMQRRYASYRKAWADRARAFITPLEPATLPKTVVYPFGGGDLTSALVVFPDATEITTLSLEAAGDIRTIDTISKKDLTSETTRVGRDIQRLFQSAYSSTNHLQQASHEQLSGTVMFALAALAVHGFEPVSFRYFTVERDGKLHYLTNQELDAAVAAFDAEAIARKKYKRDRHNGSWHEQESPFANMEIGYRPRGDGKASTRFYRHIVANLDNDHQRADDRVLQHLAAKGKVAAMTKAASFLLWFSDFTMVRDYLLGHMTWMISDASGVRPADATAAGFEQTTYGEFVKPLFDKDDENHQRELIQLWKAQPHRPLPFRFGYPDAEKHNHLMITKPRGT